MRSLVLAVSLVLALGACKGREKAQHDQSTATIAPAPAQPGETGTDAMTQTVELNDGRSVSEGGASAEGTTATSTADVTDTSTAPMTENPTTTTASTTTR
jgi:ABC-type Fe3+-hydroxamate transport system substrate-binding protein